MNASPMNSMKIRHKTAMHRPETRRFEWSALFAVALLFVALSPSFAASALASSPALTAPVVALASTSSESCNAVLLWFQKAHSETPSATPSLAVSSNISVPPAAVLSEARGGIHAPQFSSAFEQPPAVLPTFSISREHTAHRFLLSLSPHEAGYLSGSRNNRYHE